MRALVTGGTGAIGQAICRRLAADGHEVIVHTHRRPTEALALVDALMVAGRQASMVCCDVTDAAMTEAAMQKVLEAGPIQIVVSNAGTHLDGPLAGMTAATWHAPIASSLHGFFHIVQPLLLPMIRTRYGRIIAMSSVTAEMGNRGQANYAAAKAGLEGAIRSLALEVASRGITANAVAPGVIGTPETEALWASGAFRDRIPMGRPGTVDEVAAVVSFLASSDAGYISGQTIAVNGAMA